MKFFARRCRVNVSLQFCDLSMDFLGMTLDSGVQTVSLSETLFLGEVIFVGREDRSGEGVPMGSVIGMCLPHDH